jgi:hypothetical protein
MKRIFYLTLLTTALLKPALAAYSLTDPFPQQYISVLQVFTAPWPEYTFGMFYFLVLVSILMGIILYSVVSKVFPSDQFGTSASGISTAISVIMTLIVIKFTPFIYYFVVAIIIVAIAVLHSMWTLLGGLTKLVPEESKWKKVATLFVSGAIMTGVGTLCWLLTDQFSKAEVLLGGLLSIGGAITTIGIILIILGIAYAIWTPSLMRTLGGERGERAAEMTVIEDILHEGANERRAEEFSRDVVEKLTRAEAALSENNIKEAEKELKAAATDMKDKIAYYKKVRDEAKAALRPLHGLDQDALSKKGYDITEAQRDAWIRELEKFQEFINNANTHLIKLGMEEERGLHAIAKALRQNRSQEARDKLERLKASVRNLEQQEEKIEEIINKVKVIMQQLEAHPSMAAQEAPPKFPEI